MEYSTVLDIHGWHSHASATRFGNIDWEAVRPKLKLFQTFLIGGGSFGAHNTALASSFSFSWFGANFYLVLVSIPHTVPLKGSFSEWLPKALWRY